MSGQRRTVLTTVAIMVQLGVVASTAEALATEERPIRVTITAQDSAGRGLSGVVLGVALTTDLLRPPVVDALTDDDGRATLKVVVPELQEVIEIRHGFAKPDLHDKRQRAAIQRFYELQQMYDLPIVHSITLDPSTDEYELTITAWPGIDVTARVVDEHGQPHDCWIWGPPSAPGYVSKGQSKPLRPVRQGAPALIFVASNLSSLATIVRPVQLDSEQTRVNVDLGEIRIDNLNGAVQFKMCLRYPAAIPKGSFPPMGGATFVSSDGSLIASYRGFPYPPGSDVICLVDPSQDLYPSLPPGVYYVVPEWFHAIDDQVDLISASLESSDYEANPVTAMLATKELRDSDIPKIVITEGGTNRFEINVSDAHEAIRSFAERIAALYPRE